MSPEAQPNADETETAPKADAEPKGPAAPATPPAITLAADALIAAVRAWWGKQAEGQPDDAAEAAAVGEAVTAYMVAKGETHFEPPMAVRTHFGRFRLANSQVVQDAVREAIGVIIPATVAEQPLTHLPEVIRPADEPSAGAD